MKYESDFSVDNTIQWTIWKLTIVFIQISRGFYQKNGFLLLSPKTKVPTELRHKAVYLHEELLTYIQSNKLLSVQAEKIHNGSTLDNEAVLTEIHDITGMQLSDILLIDEGDESVYVTDGIREATKKLQRLLDISNLSISIHPSTIGTGSFFKINDVYHLFPVKGCSETALQSMIIGSIVNDIQEWADWKDSMAIQRFLLRETIIGEEFDWYTSPEDLQFTHNVIELFKLSEDNYYRSGYPKETALSLVKGVLRLQDGTSIPLTEAEIRIMTQLSSRPHEVITYSEIGDIIWNDTEKFSIGAITKYIERIRKKLRRAGLQYDYIVTIRGKGYVYIG